jgi:hybrid cluster-associated redox disulfide protein
MDSRRGGIKHQSSLLLRKRNEPDVKDIILPGLQECRPMHLAVDEIVDELMRKSPSAIAVFLKYQMKCVGCPIGPFHTIEDACREHSVDRAAFIADVRRAIDAEIPPDSPETLQSLGESARR